MPSNLIIRALWGDAQVCTYKKALWDIESRSRKLPGERVFAYGQHNQTYLESIGYEDVILIEDKRPEEYDRLPPPNRPHLDSHFKRGTFPDGISMWWHKLLAIRTAFQSEPIPESVLWLDFDTKVLKEPDEELWEYLACGPEFQGAQCRFKWPRAPWRRHPESCWVFHGGCLYFRGIDIVQQCLEAHASLWYQYSDETAITWIVDKEFSAEECTNHKLYRCRHEWDRKDSYFQEGAVIRWQDAGKA